jgi:hypothetical protein
MVHQGQFRQALGGDAKIISVLCLPQNKESWHFFELAGLFYFFFWHDWSVFFSVLKVSEKEKHVLNFLKDC